MRSTTNVPDAILSHADLAEIVASMLSTTNATDPMFWREVAHQMARRGYGLRLEDDKALAELQLRVIRL